MVAVWRVKKVVVDTDILIGHVVHTDASEASDLRRLLGMFFCYTTVFNAIESFGLCRTDAERTAIERSMNALKILGLNAKSGKNLGTLFSSYPKRDGLHLLIAGVCLESKLPLITGRKRLFQGIPGIKVLSPRQAFQSPT